MIYDPENFQKLGSQLGVISEDIFKLSQLGGRGYMLLVSSGQRLGVVLNIEHAQNFPSTFRIIWPQSQVTKAESESRVSTLKIKLGRTFPELQGLRKLFWPSLDQEVPAIGGRNQA